MQEAVRMMEEHADGKNGYKGKCFISCSACEDDARAVAELEMCIRDRSEGYVVYVAESTVSSSFNMMGGIQVGPGEMGGGGAPGGGPGGNGGRSGGSNGGGPK